MNVLGISGLTVGGAGIWALVILAVGTILAWWVRGIPERKRAEIAGADSEEAVVAAQWARFQKEIDRLLRRVEQLEGRVNTLEGERDQLRQERDAAVSELIKLRAANAGQGQVRQEAAVLVAAERIVDEKQRATG